MNNSVGGYIVNEYNNHLGFQEDIDPNDPNKVVNFNKMNPDTSFIYERKSVAYDTDFTVGFYFKPDSYNISYNYLFSVQKRRNEVLRIDLSDEHIKNKL